MSRILVTGGAGYIGSHLVRMLVEAGREVVVVDDLSTGHREAVQGVPLVVGDLGDESTQRQVFAGGDIAWVIHMAAVCEVGDSMRDPAGYYRNNVTRGLALLEASRQAGVQGWVFSSTAAVYGEPDRVPIDEGHAQRPTNPYGETKLAFERALQWYRVAYGMGHVAFRYFNAAGAHPSGALGEDHAPESHLIPRLLLAVANGEEVPLFGDDYPTADGTCVRDYVHVMDLGQAHLLAVTRLEQDQTIGETFNLGNGEGFSVRQVVDSAARITGKKPRTVVAPRRPGDPASLVASSQKARKTLGWRPRWPELDSIVETAWNWHRTNPAGYGGHG